MRRFLQHVRPDRFVTVSYYGFLSPGHRPQLPKARELLGVHIPEAPTGEQDAEAQHKAHAWRCPRCGSVMLVIATLRPPNRFPPCSLHGLTALAAPGYRRTTGVSASTGEVALCGEKLALCDDCIILQQQCRAPNETFLPSGIGPIATVPSSNRLKEGREDASLPILPYALHAKYPERLAAAASFNPGLGGGVAPYESLIR